MNDTNFLNNKEKIARSIREKAKVLSCPVCGNENMFLSDGYIAHDLQDDLVTRKIGSKNIPTIPIICSNCGLVREFAVGVLGLLPKENSDKKQNI
jgi:transcription elongation factor Elf1